MLLIWGWWELRCTDPLIDLRPFRNVHFLLPNVATFALGASIGAVFLLLVGYAEIPKAIAGYGFGASTLHAGSFLLPDAVCVLIAGPLVGLMAYRKGARPVVITGAVLIAATFLLLAPAHDRQWELYLGSAVFGTAVAFSLTGLYLVVGEAVSPDRAGMAQGVNSLVVGLGSATGSAAATSLLRPTSSRTPRCPCPPATRTPTSCAACSACWPSASPSPRPGWPGAASRAFPWPSSRAVKARRLLPVRPQVRPQRAPR